jgi:transcriptional regulator with XRE-family HTH domain
VNVSERLSTNLIRLREEAGLESDELALRSSVSRAQIESAEAGELVLRSEEMIKLANALDAPVSALTEGVTWRPDKGDAGEFEVLGE